MDGIQLLKTAKGKLFDVCALCYLDYLKDAQDKTNAQNIFKHLISRDIVSDHSFLVEQHYFSEDLNSVIQENRSVVEKAVNNLIDKSVEEEVFYQKLWDLVFDDIFFAEDIDKICALFCMAINEKIPYFKLPAPVDISEEEFIGISNKLVEETCKAEFIMNLGYNKKTDLSSQIIMLLDQLSDEREKIVVLANAFSVTYEKIQFLLDTIKILQDDSEDED